MFSSSAAAAFFFLRRCKSFGSGSSTSSSSVLPSSLWRRRFSVIQTLTPPPLLPYSNKPNIQEKKEKEEEEEALPPFLMLSSPKCPQTRYLYELNGNDIRLNRKIHLPDIAGHHCIGSSQGFLITVDISTEKPTEIHVINPLTGERLPLPSVASFSDIDSSFHFSSRNHDNVRWVVSWYPDLIPFETNYTHLYRSKAILSSPLPSPHSETDSSTLFLFLVRDFLPPLFTRLSTHNSSSSSSGWSPHHLMFGGLDDYVFHKGLLYAVLKNGALIVANLDNPFVTATVLPFCPRLKPVEFPRVLSLVQSPDGKDLFLVSRTLSGDKYVDNSRIRGHKVLYDILSKESEAYSNLFKREEEEAHNSLRFTEFFDVFKLEYKESKHQYTWIGVESIGDLALFVGSSNQSFSVCANDFPGLKPNCIYFTDITDQTWNNFLKVDRDGDTGVYHLEDNTIQLFQLTDDTQELNWPPLVWYRPPLPSPSLSPLAVC